MRAARVGPRSCTTASDTRLRSVPLPIEARRYAPAVRKPLALLITILLLAACSGGDDGGSSPSTAGGAGGDVTTTVGSDGGGSNGAGPVDCAAITAAMTEIGVPLQLLAQVRTPSTLAAIKEGTVGELDIDAFLAAIDVIHALDPFDSPLGDPKVSLDAYEEAGNAMKALLEADAPTQADIDAYNDTIGTIPEFLGLQIALSGGMDAANC